MSCGADFHTDCPDVPPCNRNNCRCGDEKNCMYYNSAGPGQSHYNWAAVQGAGHPGDARYKCHTKAFDHLNAAGYYGDHALGGMGSYSETTGFADKAGSVCYNDRKCSEYQYGQRDMCDDCHLDKPNFAAGGVMPRLFDGAASFLGIDKQYWLLIAAVAAFWAWKQGKLNLSTRRGQLFLVLAAVAAVLFFFRR